MPKRIFIITCLLFNISSICLAQQTSIVNPFSKLNFSTGIIDTTIIAYYSGINNDIGIPNKSIIETIAKHTGKKIKGLTYAIDLKIGNYPSLAVACNDNSMLNILRSNLGNDTQLLIRCTVYRFYTFDGICNFFYIDKVSFFNQEQLITKNIVKRL